MSKKIKTIYIVYFSVIALALISLAVYKNYFSETAPVRDISALEKKYYYLNLDKDVKYVGDENCKSCHSEIHENFHTTGMGRSLYKPSASNEIEDFEKDNEVYDKKSDYYYKVIKKGSDFYQIEFKKDKDGNITHELEKKIEYVIGSGNNTRSYLYSENGFFYEMPVSWYTEKAKWDMSPGYQNFNLRFSRPVIEECMNCHNSYTGFQEFSENRYDPHLKEGIGCERCHGPGELHVLRETDKTNLFESLDKDTIDRTIVNPVNLPLEQNLSVCFQCHLQGDVRVFTDGKKQSDFRPGMKLEEVKTVFVQDDIEKGDFKIASHAARMILSDCFIKSNGAMTCITCHDPHIPVKSVSKEFFNGKCMSCHSAESLSLKIPDRLRGEHSIDGNCVSCHMKQGGTKDVMHVNFTDHWIRKESGMKESADTRSDENKIIKLKDIVNKDDQFAKMDLGIAYVTYFETKNQDPEYLRNAIPLLEEDLKKFPEHKNGLYNLGLAYFRTGRTDEAISVFQKLVAIDPGNAQAFFMLGTAFEKAKIFPKAMESYQASLTIYPDNIKVLNSLGNLFYNNGKISDALAAYTLALNLNSSNVNVLNNLGDINLYKLKNTDAARDLLLKAVDLDPEFLPALNNLGNYYFITNDIEKAEVIFNEILKKDPANLLAMGNLAVIYEGRGEKEQAKKMLGKVLKINPGDPRALQMLDKLKQQN